MWSMIHTFFLCVGSLFYLPIHSIKSWRKGRASASLKERLGLAPLPEGVSKGQVVWVHAVSLGETKALYPVIQRLREKNSALEFVFSFATSTAREEAMRLYPFAKAYYYFPLDFPWVWKRFFSHFHPKLVILSETDFWYEFLRAAKLCGAKTLLVNGKISERSLKMFKRIRPYSDALFSQVDHFYLQNQHYQERFSELGIPSERMDVTGNLKIDALFTTGETKQLPGLNRIKKGGDRVIVLASTHPGEEKILIEKIKPLLKNDSQLKVWVAPRHPERFMKVFTSLSKEGLKTALYSQLKNSEGPLEYQLLVVDGMGLLRSCFKECQLAVVGGSFIPVGGHNILEVTHEYRPVLFGPHMHTQKEFVDLVKRYQVGEQVEADQLLPAIEKYIHTDPSGFREACEALFDESQGAAEKTFQGIHRTLD